MTIMTTGRRKLAVLTATAVIFIPLCLSILVLHYSHLLLRVPRIGFILYGLAGGPVPPFFDHAVFDDKNYARWRRPNDVVISASGKSGSTWLMNSVHELRARGRPEPFRDIYEEVRMPELVYYPGQTIEERIEILNNNSKRYDFSAYKTHLFPPRLHVRSDAKYIVGVRNAFDTVASLRPFLRNHGKAFATMWGGFPPQAETDDAHQDEASFEHYVMNDIGSGKGMLEVFLIDFVRAWWPYRKLPNVMFMHFQDRVNNHLEQTKRIMDFLDIKLSKDELDRVALHTSFEEMKKHADKFDISHIFDDMKDRGLVPKDVRFMVQHLIQQGPNRGGYHQLSPSLVARIGSTVESTLGPNIARWLRVGGDLPDEELP